MTIPVSVGQSCVGGQVRDQLHKLGRIAVATLINQEINVRKKCQEKQKPQNGNIIFTASWIVINKSEPFQNMFILMSTSKKKRRFYTVIN
jgi:hypothetical protein